MFLNVEQSAMEVCALSEYMQTECHYTHSGGSQFACVCVCVFVCVCLGPHPSGVKGSARGGWTIGANRQKVHIDKRCAGSKGETKEKRRCTERLLIRSGRCIRGALPLGASSLPIGASGLQIGASGLQLGSSAL